ncbi:hypothetical protein XU18_3744 [Perkinsela sp. CCAP 1560/4]|nr:hypothetical protein XU18_3744 [Perkinsela sp. CCAP 1560/4]|eukprot:KNH05181.1 hypothetical protein XU18_3744 [Perkinsela sp. CCAP 1560/4]
MRLAHMYNAKSREHAHTCRKARAIFKLRYKKKIKKNQLGGSVVLTQLPSNLKCFILASNYFSADPTKGHLSVVGWTSTPVLGEAKNLFKPLVVFLSWRRPY